MIAKMDLIRRVGKYAQSPLLCQVRLQVVTGPSQLTFAEVMRLDIHDPPMENSNIKIQMSNGGCAARGHLQGWVSG
jgi:hypothetical protein